MHASVLIDIHRYAHTRCITCTTYMTRTVVSYYVCVYVCIFGCWSVDTHVCTYTCICTIWNIFAFSSLCIFVSLHVYVFFFKYICLYEKYSHTCLYTHMHAHLHLYMRKCKKTWTYTCTHELPLSDYAESLVCTALFSRKSLKQWPLLRQTKSLAFRPIACNN